MKTIERVSSRDMVILFANFGQGSRRSPIFSYMVVLGWAPGLGGGQPVTGMPRGIKTILKLFSAAVGFLPAAGRLELRPGAELDPGGLGRGGKEALPVGGVERLPVAYEGVQVGASLPASAPELRRGQQVGPLPDKILIVLRGKVLQLDPVLRGLQLMHDEGHRGASNPPEAGDRHVLHEMLDGGNAV